MPVTSPGLASPSGAATFAQSLSRAAQRLAQASSAHHEVTEPLIRYEPEKHGRVEVFRAGEEFPAFQAQYRKRIEEVIDFAARHCGDTQCGLVKEGFATFDRHLFDEDFFHDCTLVYGLAREHLEQLCRLLKNEGIPLDARRNVVVDLSLNVEYCAPGVTDHLARAVRELQLRCGGAVEAAVRTKEALIREFIFGHIVDPAVEREDVVGEVHVVNSLLRHVGPEWGLPAVDDPFARDMPDLLQLRKCEMLLSLRVTLERVVRTLADECLDAALAAMGSQPFDLGEPVSLESWDRFLDDARSRYGWVDSNALMEPADDGRYRVRRCGALASLDIARSLCAAGVQDEAPQPIRYAGSDESKRSIWQLGHLGLFWVKDPKTGDTELTVNDLLALDLEDELPTALLCEALSNSRKEDLFTLRPAWFGVDGEAISLLLQKTFDDFTPHRWAWMTCNTALLSAVLHGRADVVDRLLELNADPNAGTTDSLGASILMLAAHHGHLDVVKCLIAAGADLSCGTNPRDSKSEQRDFRVSGGRTALAYAASAGHVHVVDALLDAGAPFRTRSQAGYTPLMEAVAANRLAVVKRLLRHVAIDRDCLMEAMNVALDHDRGPAMIGALVKRSEMLSLQANTDLLRLIMTRSRPSVPEPAPAAETAP